MRLLVFGMLLAVSSAHAQGSAERITGVIESYAASQLTVKTAKGESVTITLLPTARIFANEKSQFTSLRQGDFISTSAAAGKDGRLAAKEVRILPVAFGGLGEGQYPYGSTNLTNGSVVSATPAAKGKGGVLKLSFHGAVQGPTGVCTGHAPAPGQGPCIGDAEIVVGAKTPVTAWLAGDESWLQIGKAVSMFAVTDGGGKRSSPGVLVEHNGIKPLP